MRDKQAPPPPQNPAEIAREAFRLLATRRIAPTPEAYREIYEEVAGYAQEPDSETMLREFASSFGESPRELAVIGAQLKLAGESRNWPDYGKTLKQLTQLYITRTTTREVASARAGGIPVANLAVGGTGASLMVDDQPRLLRDMLTRTLTLAVSSLLQGQPALAEEAHLLGRAIKDAQDEDALNAISVQLKQFCFKIEMKGIDVAEQQDLLLRLFRLLLSNVNELLDDGSWLHGQIEAVQSLLEGPIEQDALKDAIRSLKDVIYKQGMIKDSLSEAKVTVKNMMITFIDRLSAVATSTGDYHQKIDQYAREISQADGMSDLNKILDDVMRETRHAQAEALRSRDDMLETRREVKDAEERIRSLESKLEQLSELVREDQLTGTLNRRGLDDVFERELARADRRNLPLCVAMLDLDDFKRINDTHGHSAGDEALIHLVRVIKDTLRTMDVIARFGGEEFLILLPDTDIDDAMLTVTRVQRELTKRIFMHNHEQLLMTFSAGIALRLPHEDHAALVKRADLALYEAKKAGKNRVVAAP